MVKSIDGTQAELMIRQAREVLKPTPVRTSHVPTWLKKRLVLASREGKFDVNPAVGLLGSAVLHTVTEDADDDRWLDHWGSTEDESVGMLDCFVSEPYYFHQGSVQAFADLLDLEWVMSPNSWHYPGHTFRLLFFPRKGQ